MSYIKPQLSLGSCCAACAAGAPCSTAGDAPASSLAGWGNTALMLGVFGVVGYFLFRPKRRRS